MEAAQYVSSIISKYSISGEPTCDLLASVGEVCDAIRRWSGVYLVGIQYSGSRAKGTAIRGVADVDLFISLKPETPGSLAEIYNSLLGLSSLRPHSPRRQNVSVGINHNGYCIDLVPARKQRDNSADHSLYRSKAGTWTQTNVAKHIALINQSGRLDEIRALKIWRELHGLDFPSFFLELTVITALRGKPIGAVASNFLTVLEYLRDSFVAAVVIDPANSNNRISDELSQSEKQSIAQEASSSLAKKYWKEILW